MGTEEGGVAMLGYEAAVAEVELTLGRAGVGSAEVLMMVAFGGAAATEEA